MSEWITAENIDQVIQKNKEIKEEILSEVLTFQKNQTAGRAVSMPQLAWMILEEFGLVQIPIEDKFWSGAIYVKDGKIIPVINTAQPRANQYFTAWHEIYHLIFDKVSFDHFIENDNRRFGFFDQFCQSSIDHLHLLLEVGMGDIHDMKNNVCLAHFVQRRFERFHQVMG